ncbi:MAG TPA: antibiotic biosynthesis monooxygenase family protein [Azospirillaceae bacterium]|nr:antibiotic biosynthesis monooxygenase family protein [Azospirillaceae bacterium]
MGASRRDLLAGAAGIAALGSFTSFKASAMSGTLYGLSGNFIAQPGKRDELAAILMEAAGRMHQAKGCRLYVVATQPGDDNAVWVTEVWDSEADHKASLGLPGTPELIQRARPLIAGMGNRFTTSVLGGHGLG